jgi:hypothetical protein
MPSPVFLLVFSCGPPRQTLLAYLMLIEDSSAGHEWNLNFTTNTELARKQLTFVQADTFCVLFVAMVYLNSAYCHPVR